MDETLKWPNALEKPLFNNLMRLKREGTRCLTIQVPNSQKRKKIVKIINSFQIVSATTSLTADGVTIIFSEKGPEVTWSYNEFKEAYQHFAENSPFDKFNHTAYLRYAVGLDVRSMWTRLSIGLAVLLPFILIAVSFLTDNPAIDYILVAIMILNYWVCIIETSERQFISPHHSRYIQNGIMTKKQWSLIVSVQCFLDVLLSILFTASIFPNTITEIYRFIYQRIGLIFAQIGALSTSLFSIIAHLTSLLLPIVGTVILVALLIWFVRWVIYDGLS